MIGGEGMKATMVLLVLLQQFLLRQPIQQAVSTGDFSFLESICQPRVSVNFDEPFDLNGYYRRRQFVEFFAGQFSNYEVKKLEWLTRQIEEKFAIQSLNVILKNRRSEKLVFYKFIFFMSKDKKWELYYLKGLRI